MLASSLMVTSPVITALSAIKAGFVILGSIPLQEDSAVSAGEDGSGAEESGINKGGIELIAWKKLWLV